MESNGVGADGTIQNYTEGLWSKKIETLKTNFGLVLRNYKQVKRNGIYMSDWEIIRYMDL